MSAIIKTKSNVPKFNQKRDKLIYVLFTLFIINI